MSMRMGDETARARAEAIDPNLLASEAVPPEGGQWRRALRQFRRHKLALVALGFLVFMVLACFVGAHFAPSPTEQHLLEPPAGPTWAHWFGTDELSRDSLSRVLHGGQISLRVAFGVAILSTVIGVVIGSLAGFYRGWLDNLLMRFTDLWIALPALPILAVAVSIGTVDLGPFGTLDMGGPLGITLLLSLLLWGSIARVVRGATLSLREHEFIDAARTIGASEHAHHRAARAPELLRPDHGERDARRRRSDPGREHALVPRFRHPATDTELGQPAVELDRYSRGSVVAHRVPRARDLPHRARGQFPR